MSDINKNQSNADKILAVKYFLQRLNLQLLRCPYENFNIGLKNYEKKTKITALTETWFRKADTELIKQCKTGRANLKKGYCIANYQPLLILLRDTGRERKRPSFLKPETLTYHRIVYPSDTETAIVKVCFSYSQYRNICLMYRSHLKKMSKLLTESENHLKVTCEF